MLPLSGSTQHVLPVAKINYFLEEKGIGEEFPLLISLPTLGSEGGDDAPVPP